MKPHSDIVSSMPALAQPARFPAPGEEPLEIESCATALSARLKDTRDRKNRRLEVAGGDGSDEYRRTFGANGSTAQARTRWIEARFHPGKPLHFAPRLKTERRLPASVPEPSPIIFEQRELSADPCRLAA